MVRRILFFLGSAMQRETEVMWFIVVDGPLMWPYPECIGQSFSTRPRPLPSTFHRPHSLMKRWMVDRKHVFVAIVCSNFSRAELKDPISKDEEFRLYRLVTLLLDILHHLEADIEIGFPRRWCGVRSDFCRTFFCTRLILPTALDFAVSIPSWLLFEETNVSNASSGGEKARMNATMKFHQSTCIAYTSSNKRINILGVPVEYK